jgi:DNA replication protein DnaC
LNEQAAYFNRKLISIIRNFEKENPGKCRGMEIGLISDSKGEYIWMRPWSPKLPNPVCQYCGQTMMEGTIINPDGPCSYPEWKCANSSCQDLLPRRTRMNNELAEYQSGAGLDVEKKRAFEMMNIPEGLRSKTLANYNCDRAKLNNYRNAMKTGQDIFINGETGTGKTHLAVGLLFEYGKYKPGNYRFENVPEIFELINSKISKDENYTEIIENLKKPTVLVLDDLGANKVTDYRKEVMYSVIDGRLRMGRQTIVTTNLSILQIKEMYDERIASRLSGYGKIKLIGKDWRRAG